MSAIRLGLIGGNIAASQSPALHRIAGRLCGLDVSYDLLIPAEIGASFDDVFEGCRRAGYRGLNVTYPFKEEVMRKVVVADPAQAAIGSCNTVLLGAAHHRGANTDYTGFIKAFCDTFHRGMPGHVAVAGAGGVGKAICFALGQLGADSLSIFDPDRPKADALAAALKHAFPAMPVGVAASVAEAVDDAGGLVNCTPLGMEGIGGSAFPARLLRAQLWAFDAVYTPLDTPFMIAAREAGLAVMSGYELFLHQGIDAFKIFTGRDIDSAALRRALAQLPEHVQPA